MVVKAEAVKVARVEKVNKSLHRIWIKGFLKRLGKRDPLFLDGLFERLPISNKEKQILKLRYIKGMSWDKIPDEVYLSKSRVEQLHKNCIDILESLTF